MWRLRNLLPDTSKRKRNRRKLLNVHVSFFMWILEFMFGFLGVLTFILMPFNSSRVVEIVCFAIYSIIIPGAYLLNDANLKSVIVESRLYIRFANAVARDSMNQIVPSDSEKIIM